MQIAFTEVEPFIMGEPTDEVVLVDVVGYHPFIGTLRVGDTLWACGTGVLEGVERGFLSYHHAVAKPAPAHVVFVDESLVVEEVLEPEPVSLTATSPRDLPPIPDPFGPVGPTVAGMPQGPPIPEPVGRPPKRTAARVKTTPPDAGPIGTVTLGGDPDGLRL